MTLKTVTLKQVQHDIENRHPENKFSMTLKIVTLKQVQHDIEICHPELVSGAS